MERFNVYQKQHVRMFTGILWLTEGGYQDVVKNGQKTIQFSRRQRTSGQIDSNYVLTPLDRLHCNGFKVGIVLHFSW